MKLFERIFPGFLKRDPGIYTLATIAASILIFIALFFTLGTLSVFLAIFIDWLLRQQGYYLEMGLMAVILLLVLLSVVISFILSLTILIRNIKWSSKEN
ncbi:MAG: hypothetical protein JW782_05785 [Candidatus Saganbacteria bacterium]|nr:hypothetical protein [Candidatus Saganbacteria bacterium]